MSSSKLDVSSDDLTTVIALMISAAGLTAGARASIIDFRVRKWLWVILDSIWVIGALLFFLLLFASYAFNFNSSI